MPSPFPGMDPYLEEPDVWRGVHAGLIVFTAGALNRVLPQDYAARIDQRLYVVQSDRSIYPDVAVVRRPLPRAGQAPASTAVADPQDIPGILTVYPLEMREGFIEIRHIKSSNRLVTSIEFLSRTNKAPHTPCRRLYLDKQQELLHSQVNLLEIDLLHQGEHTMAAPYSDLVQEGSWDYLVCLHRYTHPYQYEYWMNSIRQRLPRVRVPLLEGEPDVLLDPQAVLDRCYDEEALARTVDYQADPPVSLKPDDLEWIARLLREKGLRS